jgi:hypothetical protein
VLSLKQVSLAASDDGNPPPHIKVTPKAEVIDWPETLKGRFGREHCSVVIQLYSEAELYSMEGM